jgi:alpha-mannosidase
LFRWRSPDGSEVLAYRIPHRYWSPDGGVTRQLDAALDLIEGDREEAMVFYGVGNHGGGPTRRNIDSVHELDASGEFGSLVLSSPRRFFDSVAGAPDLPVWSGDLQPHARGCYSAHSAVKLWMQRAEITLLAAERWAAVSSVLEARPAPREELGAAWRGVLFNQFHDILPGTAIESAYDDARDELGGAIAVAKRELARAHGRLARRVDIPFEEGTQPFLVFNPHPWPVRQTLEVHYLHEENGIHLVDAADAPVLHQPTAPTSITRGDASRDAIAFDAELPAFGYRLYRLRSGAAPIVDSGLLRASDMSLENANLLIELDRETGWISRLLDKRTGAELAGDGRGHSTVADDPSDTWGHGVVSYAREGTPMSVVAMSLVESGPLRAIVRVVRRFGESSLTEDIVLGRDSDAIEVRATLDWRERLRVLKLRFPVAAEQPRFTVEVPFASIERSIDGAELPMQTWADLSGAAPGPAGPVEAGLAVVFAGKHGVDASHGAGGPSIGVTVVRSPAYAWHDPADLDADGPAAFQDQGIQGFRYLLVPHAGDWRDANLARRSTELLVRPRVALESAHDGDLPSSTSFISCDSDSVVITAIKSWEDSSGGGADDLVVRAVEVLGIGSEVRFELPIVGRSLSLRFRPHEIRTIRIPSDPEVPVEDLDLIEWPTGGELGTR